MPTLVIRVPLLTFLALMLSAVVHAGDDARQPDAQVRALLDRMSAAMRGLDYEGTFIYRRAEHVDTLQVFHQGSGAQERERLVTLAGKAREIIRTGEDVQCILPDRRRVLVGHQHRRKPFPSALFDDVEGLFPYYRFERDGAERVAGRETEIIAVTPRDDFRFGHRLWLDVDSGLLLRSDVVNEGGEVVEQIMFTNIVVDAEIGENELAPSMDVSDFLSVPGHAEEMAASLPEWMGRLPDGYRLVKRKQRVVGADAVTVEHLVFSDGLSSLSVFIDPNPAREDLLRGDARHGVANAYGVYHDGAHVTVVGEVPSAAVEHIVADIEAVAVEAEPR